jgi:hypothetical protein
MPKKNPCSIIDCGRMKYFDDTSLLAIYLKVDPETVRRWRRDLVKEEKPLISGIGAIMIDFEPEIFTNKNKS